MTELQIPNTNGFVPNLLFVDYVEYARVCDVALYLNGCGDRVPPWAWKGERTIVQGNNVSVVASGGSQMLGAQVCEFLPAGLTPANLTDCFWGRDPFGSVWVGAEPWGSGPFTFSYTVTGPPGTCEVTGYCWAYEYVGGSPRIYTNMITGSNQVTILPGQFSAVVRAIHGTNISLVATPATSVSAYEVYEQLPAGVVPSNITGGGLWVAASSKITWGPFLGSQARTLTYSACGGGDVSGRGVFDGVPVGTAGPALLSACPPPAGWNSALSFDGGDDFVRAADGVYFNTNFTIEAWVYVRSHKDWARLLDFGNGPASDNVWLALSDGTSSRPNFGVYRGTSSEQSITAPEPLPLNQWVHLAARLRNGIATIYTNGVAAVSGPVAPPVASVTRTKNYIGRSNWGDPAPNAVYDEIRIWNVARSREQIKATMFHPLSGSEAGLEAYWRFDEGTGTTTADATGHGHTGTLGDLAILRCPAWVLSSVPVDTTPPVISCPSGLVLTAQPDQCGAAASFTVTATDD